MVAPWIKRRRIAALQERSADADAKAAADAKDVADAKAAPKKRARKTIKGE